MAASFQMCVVWKCLTIIMCDGDDGMSNESFTRCMVVLIIPLLSFFAMTTKISNVDVVFISIVLWGDSFLSLIAKFLPYLSPMEHQNPASMDDDEQKDCNQINQI